MCTTYSSFDEDFGTVELFMPNFEVNFVDCARPNRAVAKFRPELKARQVEVRLLTKDFAIHGLQVNEALKKNNELIYANILHYMIVQSCACAVHYTE